MPPIPAVLIANPSAGSGRRGKRLTHLLDRLSASGWAAELRPTRGPGDATRLAREAGQNGRPAVFAHGGDGTIREVAKGLLGSGTALGILPGGTTNVLARALGIPTRAERAPEALARGTTASIDVGRANGEPFLMMVSGGLDGLLMRRQSGPWKRVLGRAAFALPGLVEWWRYAYPEIRLHCDHAETSATFFAVCNIPLYGGDFKLAPTAIVHDRQLDLVTHRGGRAGFAGFLRDLALGGRHLRRDDVDHRRTSRVEIEAPPRFPFQLDGDPLDVEGRLVVELAAERLRLLLPATSD